MRGLFLIVGVALAGCDDAVVLEVHPAPNVPTDTVQLFIGLGSCDDCPGIQPPQFTEVLPGAVFYREDSYRTTVVRTARVEDGVARFRIEPSEVGGAFTLAIAVDASGKSAALVRSLPLDTAGRYRVDLIAANVNTGLGPKPTTANGNFVSIWQQPGGSLPCMGFEQWVDGRLEGERVFIVPQDDLDCDARPGDECAPYGYDALGVPTFEEASCTVKTPINLNNVCKLGGPACNEVTGEQHACSPTDYCLPLAYCDGVNPGCGDPAMGGSDLEACLFDTPAPATAKLRCSLSFKLATDGTHGDPCTNNFELDLFPSAPVTNPLACTAPLDNNLLLEEPANGAPLAFTDVVTYTTSDANGKQFPLELKLGYGFGCNYKVELNGEKAPQADGVDKRVFAQLWISKSGGAMRKLLVPVELALGNDCGRASTCQLVIEQADTISACLR